MKSKKLFVVVILICICKLSSAQTFQKTYGGTGVDAAQSVQQTSDGGYIIAGSATSYGAGNADVYLIKTNATGDTLWTKTFGGTGDDLASSVEQTSDGGYIITGYTYSFGAGSVDVYLIRTNDTGDTLWTKTYGGTDQDFGNDVKQTADSGFIITGSTRSFGVGSEDVYLIKTNIGGDTLWTKTFGDLGEDFGQAVQQTNDGGYIIGGKYEKPGMDFDACLIKTDGAGNLLWNKLFGGTPTVDLASSVQLTSDGGYIIAGGANSFTINHTADVYLIKTNDTGDTLWTKTYGGSSYDRGQSVQQTTDGGYIITGLSLSCSACNPDVYLIRTNATGDTLWTKTFGSANEDYGISVKQTTDGGFIIAGYTLSFGTGIYDVYLIKTDANGNSGCNEINMTTVVTNPPTQITIGVTVVSSGGTITNPATVVSSGGTITTLCTNVSVNEIAFDNSFILFPNPSAGNLIISFNRTIMKGNVEILNILGENIISEKVFNETKKEIHLKNISGGIYFVKVFDEEKYYCRKIIIEQN